MEFKLKDVEANPFRKIERYPIQESKVHALMESISKTGFWDNIVARKVEGKAQIAYGHHRLAAMQQAFSANHVINLIIRPLTDEQMIHIMARENMEEWGTSAVIEQETVRTVVEAYAAGKVELKQPAKNSSHIRYAPSFIINEVRRPLGGLPYTAECLSEFLGWSSTKVKDTLNALALIEANEIDERVFDNLGSAQAESLVRSARVVERHHTKMADKVEEEATRAESDGQTKRADHLRKLAVRHRADAKAKVRNTVKEISRALKSGTIGYRNTSTVIPDSLKPHKQLPDIDAFMMRFAQKLRDFFKQEEWTEIMLHRKHASHDAHMNLASALINLSHQCIKNAQKLNAVKEKSVKHKPNAKLLAYENKD